MNIDVNHLLVWLHLKHPKIHLQYMQLMEEEE